jgi:hypothetical protein
MEEGKDSEGKKVIRRSVSCDKMSGLWKILISMLIASEML